MSNHKMKIAPINQPTEMSDDNTTTIECVCVCESCKDVEINIQNEKKYHLNHSSALIFNVHDKSFTNILIAI